MLLEKDRLCSSVFGFLKVAQSNANKPKALLRTKIDPFSKLQDNISQFFARRGWRTWCLAASENLELAGLQLEDNRACHPRFFARSRPELFCEAPDHWLSLCQQHVVLKRILDGYRLRRPVRDDWVMVDTKGKLAQALAIAAEVVFEQG